MTDQVKRNPIKWTRINIHDMNDLDNVNKDKKDFHAIECVCIGLQMIDVAKIKNNVTGKTNHMVAVNVQVAIPIDPEKLKGVVLTPDGLGKNFQEACPVPPILKILIHDDYLIDGYKPNLEMEDLIKNLTENFGAEEL
jgi:hypothetical protein